MRKLLLCATAFAAIAYAVPASAQVLDDPLHGEVCATGNGSCTNTGDNGTNTPIFQSNSNTVQTFGFSASPASTGTLELVVLVPDNTNLASFISPNVTGSTLPMGGLGVSLFNNGFNTPGVTDWTAITGNSNPLLTSFLNITAQPDQKLNAYLPSTQLIDPGANGFFAFTLSGLGPFSLPQPGSNQTLPDVFDLSNTLPGGSYIVGFLTEADGTVIGTANSAALFVQPTAAVPEPQTWALMLIGFIGLAWAFRSRRRTVGFA